MFQTTNQAILGIYPIGTRQKAAKIMERWPSPLGVPSPETRTVLDLKQRVRPIDISPTDVIMLCIQYPSLVSTYLHAHMYIYIYDYIYRYDICISVFLLRWIRTIYIYHISYHHISYEYILHILMRTHTQAGEALPGNLDVNMCQPLQRTCAPKTASENGLYQGL